MPTAIKSKKVKCLGIFLAVVSIFLAWKMSTQSTLSSHLLSQNTLGEHPIKIKQQDLPGNDLHQKPKRSRNEGVDENRANDYRTDVRGLIDRVNNLRDEMAASSNPMAVLQEMADIIKSSDPVVKDILAGSLVTNLLDFNDPDEAFKWLFDNLDAVDSTMKSIPTNQGKTLRDVFFDNIFQKYSSCNKLEELYGKIDRIESPAIKYQYEESLLPNILIANKDYEFLSSIQNAELKAAVAGKIIRDLNQTYYNRDEAIKCYLNPSFSSADDGNGSLISSLASYDWYMTNPEKINSFANGSVAGLAKDRFLGQIAVSSSLAQDGHALEYINQIENSIIRDETIKKINKN